LIHFSHFQYLQRFISIFSVFLLVGCSDTEESLEEENIDSSILVPPGISKFEFKEYEHLSDKAIDVYTFLPDSTKKDIPVLFVMHGANRDANNYCIEWVEPSREYNFLVVCPEIDENQFPGSAGYNLGGMYDGDILIDSTLWTFALIEPIFEYLKKEGATTVDSYGIYGHSAGSQFVHRLALYTQPLHASIFIAANAGWYNMTDFDEKFPYGFQNSPMTINSLKEKFSMDLFIILGEKDTDPNASSLRKTEEAMRQGYHRFERGNNFFNAAKKMAESLQITFNWELETVPDIGHSNFGMAPTAAKIFNNKINN